jgi:Tol biopolymer transport system component
VALVAGTRLGPYEILASIGAGGMGEVYRARDSRLKRTIAIKVLSSAVAANAASRERFEREAQAVAALNHPNIVTVYSVEEHEGVRFLTMELVEGTTLARQIPQHGLQLGQLLKLAVPLADAVAAAHERGIVHRDLKPGNIMVGPDGRVKVLDFGLAKLRVQPEEGQGLDALPTGPVTAEGQIVGTVAYMSPEQAEGRPVDHRSDIFSLGVILFELSTGHRPFNGTTNVALLSSILRDTPVPVNELNPNMPADFSRVVRRCLTKDQSRRYQSAADVRNDLEDLQQVSSQSGTAIPAATAEVSHWSRWRYVAAAAALAAIAVLLLHPWRRAPERSALETTFTQLTAEPGVEQFPSLSPDGKWMVYTGDAAGNLDIYLKSVGGQVPINLTKDSPAVDTEPAFSPDGERIAFRSGRHGGGIFIMGRTGEAVTQVTDVGFNPAWSPDGKQLLFTTDEVGFNPFGRVNRSELWVVTVDGGNRRRVQVPDAVQAVWSPHGDRIAYWAAIGGDRYPGHVMTVPAAGGDALQVTYGTFTDWNPVWAPDGKYLYFASNRGGSMNLWRVAIDERSGRTLAEPEPVTTPAPFLAHLSFAADGHRMAYASILQTQNIQRADFDFASGTIKGEPEWVTNGSRLWSSPDPSPDDQQVAVYSRLQQEDIYLFRSDGTGLRQVTNDAPVDRVPRWSPDGKRIAEFSNRSGIENLWTISPDGGGLRQLTELTEPAYYAVWSPDGARMAVSAGSTTVRTYIFDPSKPWKDQHPQQLPTVPGAGNGFLVNSWSPDGRRLLGGSGPVGVGIVTYAFDSDSYEKLADSGEWPVWLSDNRRILFVLDGKRLMLLDTQTKQTRTILSVTREVLGPPRISRDGRHIYFSRRLTEGDIWLMETK